MQKAWDELVEQVRRGTRAEDAIGLQESQKELSSEEFWQRLVVRGVGDTPLSFLPPDLGELLEVIAPAPEEELVVLPPCLCLDTVLHPEFVMPPEELLQECREEEGEGGRGRGKRKRETTPDSVVAPNSDPHSITDDDVIDLTQD